MIPLLTMAVSTTSASFQEDFSGTDRVPFWQTAWSGVTLGSTRVEAYGELGWEAGLDYPMVGRLYLLSVDGQAGNVDWMVGRQRILLPQFPRMMDGASMTWHGAGPLSVEASAGWGEHPINTWAEGVAMGRLALHLDTHYFTAGAGAWVEGGTDHQMAAHPDVSARLLAEETRLAPSLSVMAAAGIGSERRVIERARAEISLRPFSGTHAFLHAEHREVLDASSPLSGTILAAFAPQGTDEVGVGLSVNDARKDELWMSGTLSAWDGLDGQQTGMRAELSWRPNCQADAWCLRPSWRGGTGPGGSYQAMGGAIVTPFPGPINLSAHAFAVPWQTPYQDWTTASVVGLDADIHASPWWQLAFGGEVGHDIIADRDVHAWATLRVVLR